MPDVSDVSKSVDANDGAGIYEISGKVGSQSKKHVKLKRVLAKWISRIVKLFVEQKGTKDGEIWPFKRRRKRTS